MVFTMVELGLIYYTHFHPFTELDIMVCVLATQPVYYTTLSPLTSPTDSVSCMNYWMIQTQFLSFWVTLLAFLITNCLV